MVKFRFMLIAVLLVSASANMSAAWRIVFDRNCLKIVMANTASQKLIEEQHNQRVDTIAAKKQKVELYTVSMATMKELYKLSMENISGFGTESLYYKEIGLCALDILRNVPVLVSTVNKARFSNRLLCLNELGNLVAETQQLVGNFVNIVNNARIPNPLQGQATAEKKDDGYNLLDRYERLTLANSIYTDLNRIRYKVEGMVLMAQYATANDLFFAIDPEGWANVVTMKNHVGNLVQDWNGLVASNYYPFIYLCHETQEYKYHISRYYNAVAACKGFRFHNTQRPADHRSTHCPAQGHKEGRGQGSDKSGHKLWRAVAH